MFLCVERNVQNICKDLRAPGEDPGVCRSGETVAGLGGHTEGLWTHDQGGQSEFVIVPMSRVHWQKQEMVTVVRNTHGNKPGSQGTHLGTLFTPPLGISAEDIMMSRALCRKHGHVVLRSL